MTNLSTIQETTQNDSIRKLMEFNGSVTQRQPQITNTIREG